MYSPCVHREDHGQFYQFDMSSVGDDTVEMTHGVGQIDRESVQEIFVRSESGEFLLHAQGMGVSCAPPAMKLSSCHALDQTYHASAARDHAGRQVGSQVALAWCGVHTPCSCIMARAVATPL